MSEFFKVLSGYLKCRTESFFIFAAEKQLLHIMKKLLSLFLTLSLIILPLQAQQLAFNERNIDEIVKALTLEEKVDLIVGGHDDWNQPRTETMIGKHDQIVYGAAGITNEVTRLGITPTVYFDGPAGVRIGAKRPGDDTRTYYATAFPIATALASTWNTDLVNEVTRAMGNEVLEYGGDVLLAPGTNIHRHALCGRNFEYFSEDPLLSGKMSAAYINGIQSQGVGTSIKHFAANNQETLRMYNDSRVDERALREIYFKPFEIALREANPWTIMSSYNRLNGEYVQESSRLLTQILREEWGYDGIVVTDWTGTRNTVQQIIAGNDNLQPGNSQQMKDLVEGVHSGKITMETIDQAVTRILRYILKTPRYRGYKYSDAPDLMAHAEVVRRCGSEAMVLLKNNGNTLPLEGGKTVALFGITSYNMIAGGTGSGFVNKAYMSQLSEALEDQGFTLTDDLKQLYNDYKAYATSDCIARYGQYWWWRKPLFDEACIDRDIIDRQAEKADLAIFTLGRTAGEAADRKIDDDFNLTTLERQLLSDICDAFHLKGKKVIVVLNTSGVVETASWKEQPDAILLAWQSGQEAGNSVADILSGKVCPSGKLPSTFPNNCTDPLAARNFPLFGGNEKMPVQSWDPRSTMEYTDYAESIYVGYRYFQTMQQPVSYPFGYGLSYTTFELNNAKMRNLKDGFEVSVTVKNTGDVAGKEVVQLYVSAPAGALEKPASELKAFVKTRTLQPGEHQTLSMKVCHYALASYDEARQQWVTESGDYVLHLSSDVLTPLATLHYTVGKTITYNNNYNYKTQ